MRSLRTAQILASRSLLLSARSTTPRPPPLRWPLGKELPLVPSSRALQRWIAGAVSFSLTFTMAAAAEVRAKERLPTDLLPQNVMLYQYQAFPFCNKVRAVLLPFSPWVLTTCASTFWEL
uniref:Uncharacterized protein n=1 Tax=Avena sativa TaxID=4498 RepID=A0ACD5VI08_AVESA